MNDLWVQIVQAIQNVSGSVGRLERLERFELAGSLFADLILIANDDGDEFFRLEIALGDL
jgi:hypothetical protein